jgi:serine/threonine-protein kinase
MRTDDRLLAGRYRLQEILSSCSEAVGHSTLGVGMATVWRADDEFLHRQVAVKVLADVSDDRARARLLHEAQAAGRLAGPHVVTVYDVAEHGSMAYIVMEYVPGRSLAQVLEGAEPFEAAEAVNIAVDVLAALDVAHRRNLIHGDVKPGNILLSDGGGAKLSDFGIAKGLSRASETITGGHRILGTPRYLSPEQVNGQPVTPCSDLYSLGIVLYEMLAGAPPFDHDNAMAVALAHVESRPPPLGRHRPDLPVALMVAVHRALEKDPRRRFEDAAGMCSSLLESLEVSQPPAAAVPAVAQSTTRPSPRALRAPASAPTRRRGRRTVAVLLGVAVVALLTTVGRLLLGVGTSGADPASQQAGRQSQVSASPAGAARPPPGSAAGSVLSATPPLAELGLDGVGLTDRIEGLGALEGAQRSAEAARLVGEIEVAADQGRVARAFSEPAIAALLDETGIAGLTALAEADPPSAGPSADATIAAVAQVGEVRGQERAVAAADVLNSAKIAERDGEVSRAYAGAVIQVMAAEAGTAGLAGLLERDGDVEAAAVADDLRSLEGLDGAATDVEVARLYNEAVAQPLPGDLDYTTRRVLEPLLKLRGMAGLAESHDLLTGPSGRDQLLEVRSLRGQERARAAAAVLGAAAAGAAAGEVPSSYATSVRIALRSDVTMAGVAAFAASTGTAGAELAEDLIALDGLAAGDRSARIVALFSGVRSASTVDGAVVAAAMERLRQELSVDGLVVRVSERPDLAGPDSELTAGSLATLQGPEDATRSAQAARLYGQARQLDGAGGDPAAFAMATVKVLAQYPDVAGLIELSGDETFAGPGAADLGQHLRELAAAVDEQRAELAATLLEEAGAMLEAGDVTPPYAAAVREVLNNSAR